MIAIIAAICALILGIGIGYLIALRILKRSPDSETKLDASGIRWEKNEGHRPYEALRQLRRHFPTHEIVTGTRFLDIVEPKGTAATTARRRCEDWTVAVVMIDKRTDRLSRVILRDDDAHAQEKRWVLRRAGIKVTVISPDADEDVMRAALAA